VETAVPPVINVLISAGECRHIFNDPSARNNKSLLVMGNPSKTGVGDGLGVIAAGGTVVEVRVCVGGNAVSVGLLIVIVGSLMIVGFEVDVAVGNISDISSAVVYSLIEQETVKSRMIIKNSFVFTRGVPLMNGR